MGRNKAALKVTRIHLCSKTHLRVRKINLSWDFWSLISSVSLAVSGIQSVWAFRVGDFFSGLYIHPFCFPSVLACVIWWEISGLSLRKNWPQTSRALARIWMGDTVTSHSKSPARCKTHQVVRIKATSDKLCWVCAKTLLHVALHLVRVSPMWHP